MFARKTRVSDYTLRLSSPRVSPSNSLTDAEWDNEILYNRKTKASRLSKKIRRTFVAITGGLTIAILIIIAILVPLMTQSKTTTAKSTRSTLSVTAILNVSPPTTILVTNTVSATDSTTTTTSATSASTSTSTNSESSTSTSAVTTTTESSASTSDVTTTTTESSTSTNDSTTTTEGSTSTSDVTTTTESSTSTSDSTTTTEGSTSTSDVITTTESSTSTSNATTTTTETSSTSTSTTSSTTVTSGTMAPLQWYTNGSTVAGQLYLITPTPTYLYFPIGILIDPSDTLYVADTRNARVQKFALGNTTGNTVAGQSSGTAGTYANYLSFPSDVAVDSNGNVYVADSYNHRVQLWRVNASSGVTVAGNGTAGNSSTQLDSPRAIALDTNTNTLYVSDGNNNRIMSYTLNSTIGTLIAGGNGAGTNRSQLYNPRGLHFDSTTNSLLIVNNGAHNVVRWIIGASNWTLIAGNLNVTAANVNSSMGSSSTALNNPWDVTLDPMGNIYVTDRYNHRVQFFRAGEMNATTIAGVIGQSGDSSTQLNQPLSVTLDSQLNLYVSDAGNNRIQKFIRY